MAGEINYSGENTILYLLQMIKGVFVKKEAGKGLSTNDYTTAEKEKLEGLKNYTLPTASASVKGGIKVGAGLSMDGDVLNADGGGEADAVKWANVTGKPDASTDIGADQADKTKYATPYAVHQYVGTKLGAALSYKGSIPFASLPALSAKVAGHVYNITDEFTTTSNFIEGAGHKYAAGQNVAIAEVSSGVYRYDALSQPIDLSGYAKQSEVDSLSEAIADLGGRGDLWVSMPDYIHVKVGSEFNVYYRNILSRDDVLFWVGYIDGLTTHYYTDYLSIVADSAGTYTLPWKVYSKGGNLLDSGNLSVIATAKVPSGTTKAILIGDSTVKEASVNKASELYAADGATLTFLGTQGNGKTEGYPGWTAEKFCTAATDNPFYNNGFDFAYYITNQGYSGVQAVAIQLGINDIFRFKDYSWAVYDSTAALGYINQIVTSIIAYDSNIKVIVNLPTTPNSDGTKFTETYGTNQIYWFYNNNIIRFAEELKDYFTENPNVVISANNCILDTKTQIMDGVHPTTDGYTALGQRLYEVILSVTESTGGDTPSYTNLADPTADGWVNDSRIGSDGVAKAEGSCMGVVVTNFIHVSGKTRMLYVKGLDIVNNAPDGNKIAFSRYSAADVDTYIGRSYVPSDKTTVTGDVTAWNAYSGILDGEYARLSGTLLDGYTAEDVIITLDEPIT